MSPLAVNVHITLSEVITGFILYGIIHGAYKLIYKLLGFILKRLETETDQIIREHVRDSHKPKLKNCLTENCAILQK